MFSEVEAALHVTLDKRILVFMFVNLGVSTIGIPIATVRGPYSA